MFSGIIEATGVVLNKVTADSILRIEVSRPASFDDISIGDSIAVDGACLTVEEFDAEKMQFALAPESIQVLQCEERGWPKKSVNLERSLKWGGRIHGHLVSGHVDGLGVVKSVDPDGESKLIQVEVPKELRDFFWFKGSVALNGVSLTINAVNEGVLSVCIIPETLKRTNIGDLKTGDAIHVEVDQMARGIVQTVQKGAPHV